MNDYNAIDGLTTIEAKRKLEQFGYNEIENEKPKTVFHFIYNIVKEPMILLLLTGAGIYFVLGDPKEAGILLISVLAVMAITIYQEQKTEKSIQALKSLASPMAKVVRDGKEMEIPSREVVMNDLIIFAEGDKIPADCKIIECANLKIDESILTGESVAVTKIEIDTKNITNHNPGGDNVPFAYSGTLVVSGHGLGEVIATGEKTQMGKIGSTLQSLSIEKTLLQQEISKVVKILAMASLLFCVILVVVYGLTRHDFINAFLAGITMAMSILPEEFPIVLTLFLTMGAWRLAQKKVLARRAATIETLGSTTVLCVDKTGTLTQNKMAISQIAVANNYFGTNDFQNPLLKNIIKTGMLASQKNPFDPMEKAFMETGLNNLKNHNPYFELELVKEYVLEKESLSVINAYKLKNKNYLIAAKGSPEAIFDLCHLKKDEIEALQLKAKEMATQGLRIIAVAEGICASEILPEDRHEFKFNFLGLVGLADPVREGVSDAVKLCISAGIRVVMITGDYPETAKSIAKQIGLTNNSAILTGDEISQMNEVELSQEIKNVSIFSRVMPEQKLRIVNAFKLIGEVVAMTGDGVNDAPALKSAHIGIAMGLHGTDVAREAAAIVLLDDNFVSIVAGVKLGRRIYENLKKAMTYIFAVHIPIVGLSLIPVFFGWPLILLPIHIVFLELIIDPACTMVFENEKEAEDIMKRTPKKLDEPIFSRQMVIVSLTQGLVALFIVILAYKLTAVFGLTENESRAFTFATLTFSNLFLIITNRSSHHGLLKTLGKRNIAFILVTVFASSALILAIYLPILNNIFRFSPLGLTEFGYTILLGFISVLWFDLYKHFWVKKT